MTDECPCNLCHMIKHMTWISVKDRLPDNQTYLVLYDEEMGCCPGYFEKSYWSYFFYGNECNAQAMKVTHWMPLPEPPNVVG